MELHQLRHFVAVAETGSFTKGALRVAVSQPALSASVAKLERELDAKLFTRTPRTVTLTAAGRRLLEAARQILSACHRVKADLRASLSTRPFRIGVLRTLPTVHLAHLMIGLRRSMPETTIELVDGARDELAARLADRKLSAAITSAGDTGAAVRSVTLRRERYAVVVSLSHRFASCDSIALDDLQGEPFIVRSHCETFASTTKLLSERGIRTHVVYRTDQDDRAIALVASGLGLALMPELHGSADVRTITVRDFHVEREIELQWNEDEVDERLENLVAFSTSHNWRERIAS
ncbi:LysR family transcriptional regulator [Methylobacterium sp. Leaf118]|uniref:LysR family transcriptional regulator n=1 Tax=Methylobacterium sp. Leaf118 TaxID=2876562 RepID=UPI001E390D72|nr:LysR family transcriptional regulator [Methylobacterium sp. Leaf118]